MRRPPLMRLALGVGLLTIPMLALTACGGGGGSSAQEVEKEEANKVHRIPEDSQTYEGKPLPAGRYATEEFRPAMSFRLDEGWTRGGTELRDVWDLRDLENDAFWLVFITPEEVYDPSGARGLKIATVPEDMVAWLQANPHLKPDKPKPTSVGGQKGVRLDAIVTGAAESPECPGCVDLPLFRLCDRGASGVEKGEKVRFIVLEGVEGQTVTIFVEASPQGFDEFMPKAQKVIDTAEWKGK